MKKFAMLLAVVSVVALVAGVALTAETNLSLTTTGTVVKVDGKTLVLKVDYKDREGKDATVERKIATDDKTEVTLDGKAAKLDDLKEGQSAVVTYAPGKPGAASLVAAKIEATSPAK